MSGWWVSPRRAKSGDGPLNKTCRRNGWVSEVGSTSAEHCGAHAGNAEEGVSCFEGGSTLTPDRVAQELDEVQLAALFGGANAVERIRILARRVAHPVESGGIHFVQEHQRVDSVAEIGVGRRLLAPRLAEPGGVGSASQHEHVDAVERLALESALDGLGGQDRE